MIDREEDPSRAAGHRRHRRRRCWVGLALVVPLLLMLSTGPASARATLLFTTPATGNTATTGADGSGGATLAATLVPPDSTSQAVAFRGCGPDCYVAAVTWSPRTSAPSPTPSPDRHHPPLRHTHPTA